MKHFKFLNTHFGFTDSKTIQHGMGFEFKMPFKPIYQKML